ncbi:MAG TPA: phosphoribosylanthranilate isomerase [Rhizomicrobium sp.]|jgi:phosphoribosylanthranilate isomerase|nr:phosphoribosylanthranilate isomerase [Rhizomicrobium sp.]
MPVQVKICGINSAAAADAVLRAGADFGGLVFFPKSPRNLGLEEGTRLAERMRGRVRLAALVVDESDDRLAAIAREIKPDFFQLHGRETTARVAEIRARFGLAVIKALSVAEPGDLSRAADYERVADMLLFDATPAAGATRPGGHGAAFDWQMLNGRQFSRPWFLAGGLNSENVGRAIAVSGAALVDVSSGVESAPGIKSDSRIAEFVVAAREKVRV